MIPNHTQRYVNKFAGRINVGDDTMEVLNTTVSGLSVRWLPYTELVS